MAVVDLTTQQIRTSLQNSSGGQLFFLGTGQFTFSIPVAGSTWPGAYGAGTEPTHAEYAAVSTTQANDFRQALALWDDLIAPDFSEIVETPGVFGELRVAFTDTAVVAPGFAGYAYSGTPGAPGGKVGDIWLNADDAADDPDIPGDDFAVGTQGFNTLVHEIGHTLGLKHPFDAPVIAAPYDNIRYTVMAYNSPGFLVTFASTQGGGIAGSFSSIANATPMVVDIVAVQAIYGQETSTRAGNDTYLFLQSDATLRSIYDAGGTDTIDLSAFTRRNIVDLRPGGYSSIGYFTEAEQRTFWKAQFIPFFSSFIDSTFDQAAQAGGVYDFSENLGIAFTTTIENVFGGSAADDLGGNSAANLIKGDAGQDTIQGREGNDTIEGGADTDTAVYSGNRADYLTSVEGQGFRLIDQRGSFNDGSDFVTGVEQFKFADGTVLAANLVLANAVPVAKDDTRTTAEDTTVTIIVLANDTDGEGDTLSVTGAGDPPHGTATVNSDNTISYTPDADYNGQDSFTYSIKDGKGGTASATVTVTITAVNDAPVADADGPYTAIEDTTLTVSAATGVLTGDTDIDGGALTAQLVSTTKNGELTLNTDGSFTYVSGANFNGSDSFSYQAKDSAGALSATQTIAIGVTAVNDGPDAVNDSGLATAYQTPLVTTAAMLLANDTDVDGDTLTIASVQGATNGTVGLAAGKVTFTPSAGYSGAASYNYTVSDGNGGTDTATVGLTVAGQGNTAPTAVADGYAASEDTTLTVAAGLGVLANDTDAESDALTATLATNTAHGTLALSANGSFVYTPDANYNGPDSFTYMVSDGKVSSSPVTVTLTVAAVNDAPEADADGPYAATEDTTLTVIAANGVLSGDTDVDGDALTAQLVATTQHGVLALQSDGSFSYSPDADYNGSDSFSYQSKDSSDALSATQTVTINVAVAPGAPNAVDDSARIVFNAPVTIAVLANDTDAEGNALSVAGVGLAAHGTVVLNGNGTVTYTPEAGYRGTDSFTYTISDGNGGGDTATVSLAAAMVPTAQTVLTPGQSYGVTGFNGFPTDVFITGTSAGSEVITVGDFTTAGFSNNFATGVGDTIRLVGLASNFTVSVSGNQVSLISAIDRIALTLPAGFNSTNVVFETSANVFNDSRILRFVADGADADSLPDLFLGAQRVIPDILPISVLAFA